MKIRSLPVSPPAASKGNGAKLARLNSPWFLSPATAGRPILLYFALFYLNDFLTHESTDDAFIGAHVLSIAPRMAGQVLAVHVFDTQIVRSNDLLMEIDAADYRVKARDRSRRGRNRRWPTTRSCWAVYELMRKKVVTAEASARKAKADAEASAATAKRAEADLGAARNLKENTVSQQEFDAAKAANISAQADLVR